MEPNAVPPSLHAQPPRLLAGVLVGAGALTLTVLIWLDTLAQPYVHHVLTARQAADADGAFFDILTVAAPATLLATFGALAAGAWRWKAGAIGALALALLMTLMLGGICLQRWQIYTNGRDDTSAPAQWDMVLQKLESGATGKSTRYLAWLKRGDSPESYRIAVPAEWMRTVQPGQVLRITVRAGAHGTPWLTGAPVFMQSARTTAPTAPRP